ncbi:unnamed protein product, partial [Rotaria magnacalcarata]
SPIDKQTLDRICGKILPRINDKVNKLTVEPLSIERIFHAVDYVQLNSLSFVNFSQEILLRHILDNAVIHRLMTEQITCLHIQVSDEVTSNFPVENHSNIFSLILFMCKNLNDLTFSHWFIGLGLTFFIYKLSSTSCVSSTLTKLRIHVNTFDDCLFLLDGRLESLSTLIINIVEIFNTSATIDNTKKLPKLKCFALTSYHHTSFYDSQIVPLLRRMSNLEELTLFLSVIRMESTYIDGIHLHDEILIHMPRLDKLMFSITTMLYNINAKIDLQSNDDIQRGFIEKEIYQVDSYVINDPSKLQQECHIYSKPYPFDVFFNLNSRFPGAKFNKVRWLIMRDGDPFENELFKIISQDFPFLKKLAIFNTAAQQNKRCSLPFITFLHLRELYVHLAHIDYAEQFLYERNAHLPCLSSLEIRYETLSILTNNFTNDAARANCAKLQRLVIKEPFVHPQYFHSYFPLLQC